MSAPLDQDRNVLVNKLRAEVAPAETPSPEGEAPSDLTFEGLYEQRFEDVSRWVRALGAAEADRDDLVQEIFLVVHRRLADFGVAIGYGTEKPDFWLGAQPAEGPASGPNRRLAR